MLAYILALAVGLCSFAFYMAAFFFPEIHRKNDFIWSGVGMFYALVLWVCAGRITGGVLLGQVAGVSLLGWLGWQTLTLRRQLTAPIEKTEVSPEVEKQVKSFSLTQLTKPVVGLFRRQKPETKTPSPQAASTSTKTPAETTETAPPASREEAQQEIAESNAIEATPAEAESELKVIPPEPAPTEMVEAAQPQAEPGEKDTKAPVEEIAPEAELAPNAEPSGDGGPEMRANPPEPNVATEAVPVKQEEAKNTEEKPENPPQQT